MIVIVILKPVWYKPLIVALVEVVKTEEILFLRGDFALDRKTVYHFPRVSSYSKRGRARYVWQVQGFVSLLACTVAFRVRRWNWGPLYFPARFCLSNHSITSHVHSLHPTFMGLGIQSWKPSSRITVTTLFYNTAFDKMGKQNLIFVQF